MFTIIVMAQQLHASNNQTTYLSRDPLYLRQSRQTVFCSTHTRHLDVSLSTPSVSFYRPLFLLSCRGTQGRFGSLE